MNMNKIYKQRCVQALFPESMQIIFHNIIRDYERICEIRIRQNGPLQIKMNSENFYIDYQGNYVLYPEKGIHIKEKEFDAVLNHICRHSVYAFEQELKNGYLTVEGGHRIGVVGQTVWDGRQMKSIKYFNAINIRLAHEVKGIADKVMPFLVKENMLMSTLIVSPPGCGKTTLLRDLVRKISNGSKVMEMQNVSLIDERSEIASCYLGIAQNDVGMHTDILDACPKAVGMMMVLRSMSPQVIAVDELGGEEDYIAMQQAFYLGCKMIATIHGSDYEILKKNMYLQKMLGPGGFERIVILGGKTPGKVINILNDDGEEVRE